MRLYGQTCTIVLMVIMGFTPHSSALSKKDISGVQEAAVVKKEFLKLCRSQDGVEDALGGLEILLGQMVMPKTAGGTAESMDATSMLEQAKLMDETLNECRQLTTSEDVMAFCDEFGNEDEQEHVFTEDDIEGLASQMYHTTGIDTDHKFKLMNSMEFEDEAVAAKARALLQDMIDADGKTASRSKSKKKRKKQGKGKKKAKKEL